jgi:putative ABC transport system permease protein
MHSGRFLKLGFRAFRKNLFYRTINIVGLSVAFTTLILTACYLYQENSYESFYTNADRIFRPTYHVKGQGDFEVHWARIPVDYINELPAEIPAIERLIRFQNQEQKYLRIGTERYKPKHAYVTDADVFEVFDLPFIFGDPTSALIEPHSIVLTETTALRYFGNKNVLGEEITVTGEWNQEETPFLVTGVIEDIPVNTHLPMEILMSFGSEEERTGWAYIYALLAEGTEVSEVEKALPDFMDQYDDPYDNAEVSLVLQPLRDIHLHSNLAREIVPNGNRLYVRIFFWVGLLVWLIALINFANLKAAIALSRLREMGVRKVMGASRMNLTMISLMDSIGSCFIALCLSALAAGLVFPSFTALTGISMFPPLYFFIPFLFLSAALGGLLAGILPTWISTSSRILDILKTGKAEVIKRGQKLPARRVLIGVQFCTTVVLFCSALLAFDQFKFVQNKNLGLRPDQILVIPGVPDDVKQAYPVFKNRVVQIAGVEGVSACMQTPSTEIRDVGPVLIKGFNEDPGQAPMMDIQVVDPDFIDLMDLEIMAGEDFTARMELQQFPDFDETTTAATYISQAPRTYLINETAMRQLGWRDSHEALGQEIKWSIGPFELAYGPVRAIVKDFHQESLKNSIDPLIMVVEPLWLGNFLVKVQTSDIEQTLRGIEEIWNESFPYPFEYHFMDEMYDKLYHSDRVQLKLLSALALLAIVISFMGLIGMVAYALRRRSKEMAIRRVIGADLQSLSGLIGREYLTVLSLAVIVGIPLSYRWVSVWLQNFAYRIEISPWTYFYSIGFIYLLLLITIVWQTFKATGGSPVKYLREE